jgi:hypothetical protein
LSVETFFDKDYSFDSDELVRQERAKSRQRSSDEDECLYGDTPPNDPKKVLAIAATSSLAPARIAALLAQP